MLEVTVDECAGSGPFSNQAVVTGIAPEMCIRDRYTDSNGLYLFDSLFMGQYLVEVAASNFGPGGALQGYNSSSAGVTLNSGPYETAPDPDTNIDGDDNGTFNGNLMFPGSVFSDTITLSDIEPLNETPDNDLSGSPDENSNLTIDLGFVIEVTIGGNVWFDVDNDGLQPGTESTVAGVTEMCIRDS